MFCIFYLPQALSINLRAAVKPKREYASSVSVPLEDVPETSNLFPAFIAETIFESNSGVSAQARSFNVNNENFFPSIVYLTIDCSLWS